MSQENRVKIGRDNYTTTDGTPHYVEPLACFQTLNSTNPANIGYSSGVVILLNSAAQSYALLEANAPGNVLKVGQRLTIKTALGTTTAATIKPTPSTLTTGATANVVYSQPGAPLSPTGGIIITGYGSVTLRYLGNNVFNVTDYNLGASSTIAFT